MWQSESNLGHHSTFCVMFPLSTPGQLALKLLGIFLSMPYPFPCNCRHMPLHPAFMLLRSLERCSSHLHGKRSSTDSSPLLFINPILFICFLSRQRNNHQTPLRAWVYYLSPACSWCLLSHPHSFSLQPQKDLGTVVTGSECCQRKMHNPVILYINATASLPRCDCSRRCWKHKGASLMSRPWRQRKKPFSDLWTEPMEYRDGQREECDRPRTGCLVKICRRVSLTSR